MNKKKPKKKLQLAASTIVQLTDRALTAAGGGHSISECFDPHCKPN